jgi:hypothetical protein
MKRALYHVPKLTSGTQNSMDSRESSQLSYTGFLQVTASITPSSVAQLFTSRSAEEYCSRFFSTNCFTSMLGMSSGSTITLGLVQN